MKRVKLLSYKEFKNKFKSNFKTPENELSETLMKNSYSDYCWYAKNNIDYKTWLNLLSTRS